MKRATLLAAILVLAAMCLAQEGPNSVSFESAAPVSVAPGHTAQVTLLTDAQNDVSALDVNTQAAGLVSHGEGPSTPDARADELMGAVGRMLRR